jgi:hypothetical protein
LRPVDAAVVAAEVAVVHRRLRPGNNVILSAVSVILSAVEGSIIAFILG